MFRAPFSNPFVNPFPSAGAASAFSPTDISGLQLWLDFSDIATLFQDVARTVPVVADGDVIGGVSDKSTNNRHHTQGTTANKPVWIANQINGLGVGRDAGNDYLDYVGTVIDPTNYAVFIVRKSSSTGTAYICFNSGGSGFVQLYHITTGNARYNQRSDTNQEVAGGVFDYSAANGQFHRHRVRRPGANTFYQKIADGTETSVAATIGTATLTTSRLYSTIVAASLKLNGDIAAVLAYSPSPSAENLSLIDAYLLDRFGV